MNRQLSLAKPDRYYKNREADENRRIVYSRLIRERESGKDVVINKAKPGLVASRKTLRPDSRTSLTFIPVGREPLTVGFSFILSGLSSSPLLSHLIETSSI